MGRTREEEEREEEEEGRREVEQRGTKREGFYHTVVPLNT